MKKSTISYLDKRSLIYEGKTKLLLENAEENTYALHFKDSVSRQGNAGKEETITRVALKEGDAKSMKRR